MPEPRLGPEQGWDSRPVHCWTLSLESQTSLGENTEGTQDSMTQSREEQEEAQVRCTSPL